MNLQDVIFLALGIGVMVFALLWGHHLGNRPVELGFGKLGLSLKADGMPLIFLLGFLMAGVGVFFRYRGYESEIQRLGGDLAQVKGSLRELTDELKNYDMGLNLVFPPNVNPELLDIQVLTKKTSDHEFVLRSDISAEVEPGGTWVNFPRLSRGEKIKIVARGPDSTTWATGYLEIPKTQIQMVKTEQR
jgi:hypothetical protein